MKKFLILFFTIIFFYSVNVTAQLNSSETELAIDKIKNNTASDITLTPTNNLIINSTSHLEVPSGTTAERDGSPTNGAIRYNTDLNEFEGFVNSVWDSIGGGLELTTKGNLIGFDSSVTKECVLDSTDDYLLTRDSTADCGFDFKPAPVSTTLSLKAQVQMHDGVSNVAFPGDACAEGTFMVRDDAEVSGWKCDSTLQGKLNPVTDWENATSVSGGFTTNTTYTAKIKRVGDSASFQYKLTFTGAPSGSFTLDLPGGLIVDETKLEDDGTNRMIVGYGNIVDGGLVRYPLTVLYDKTNDNFLIRAGNASATYLADGGTSSSAPVNITSGDYASFNIKSIPIVGWSSGLDAAVQNIELTAQTANELSARFSSSGLVVNSENYDWLTSCTSPSTGRRLCTINAGVFTEPPSCVCVAAQASSFDRECHMRTVSATTLDFQVTSNSTNQNYAANIVCSKQGADVNKSQVITGTFENINSTDLCFGWARNNDAESITGTTENVPFKDIVEDNCGGFTNDGNTGNNTIDTYVAPRDSRYLFNVCVNATATMEAQARVNGTSVGNFHNGQIQTNCGSLMLTLNEGDEVQVTLNTTRTLAAVASRHKMQVQELPDTESIIKNLNDNNNIECQTKFLSADITTDTVGISDLQFNNLTIGKKYEINVAMNIANGVAQDNIQLLINGFDDECFLRMSTDTSNAGVVPIGFVSCKLTATATTMTTDVSSIASPNKLQGNGTTRETHVQLCEMPDNTILNSSKFD